MKKYFINNLLLFLGVSILLICTNKSNAQTCCEDRWWQKEIPTPSYNQVINPNYLEKKRELLITCDDLCSSVRERNHIRDRGVSTKEIDEWIEYIAKKINKLEHELSQIPIYRTKSPD